MYTIVINNNDNNYFNAVNNESIMLLSDAVTEWSVLNPLSIFCTSNVSIGMRPVLIIIIIILLLQIASYHYVCATINTIGWVIIFV